MRQEAVSRRKLEFSLFFKGHEGVIPFLPIDTVTSGLMFRGYSQVLIRATSLKAKPTQRIEDGDRRLMASPCWAVEPWHQPTSASHYQG